MLNQLLTEGTIILTPIMALFTYFGATIRKMATKLEDTVTEQEVRQLIDDKLAVVDSKHGSLKDRLDRIEDKIGSLDDKIDRLLALSFKTSQ